MLDHKHLIEQIRTSFVRIQAQTRQTNQQTNHKQKIKIARSNLNTKQSARFLLLKAGAHKPDVCAPKEAELKSLKMANTILALKKPDRLLKWLGSDGNCHGFNLEPMITNHDY